MMKMTRKTESVRSVSVFSLTPYGAACLLPPLLSSISEFIGCSHATYVMALAVSVDAHRSLVESSSSPFFHALSQFTESYAAAFGLTIRHSENAHLYRHVPFACLPTPVNKSAWNKVKKLAQPLAKLMDCVARDTQFLEEKLHAVAIADPTFTGRLLTLLKDIQTQTHTQKTYLAVIRADYMMHEGKIPQQVEVNTISVSFAGLAGKMSDMHASLCARYAKQLQSALPEEKNKPGEGIVDAMAKAVDIYRAQQQQQQQQQQGNKKQTENVLIVLSVVQENETNTTDQKIIEFDLIKRHGIPMIRMTMAEIHQNAQLRTDGQLDVFSEADQQWFTVALAYYRAAYVPRDFKSEIEWETYTMIERSLAIKCPSVAYHLAGCKKIQQVLSEPGMLERFVNADMANQLRSTFTDMWALKRDDPIFELVRRDPHEYVLKPQREGGGNNLWDAEMLDVLKRNQQEELDAYILMRRIRAQPVRVPMLREGQLIVADSLSELGIYSTMLSEPGGIEHINACVGHLLRTKTIDSNEGGVAAGFAVLDSPLLV